MFIIQSILSNTKGWAAIRKYDYSLMGDYDNKPHHRIIYRKFQESLDLCQGSLKILRQTDIKYYDEGSTTQTLICELIFPSETNQLYFDHILPDEVRSFIYNWTDVQIQCPILFPERQHEHL